MQGPHEDRDRQLWADLKKGKEKAFSELFLLYAQDLYHYGFMLCRNKELVEDCLQDLFLHLWRKRSMLNDVNKVLPYLITALHNRIQDAYRKIKDVYSLADYNEVESQKTISTAEDRWVDSERHNIRKEVAQKALNSLPERMRKAIYLRYFKGLEYADIADTMNIQPQVAVNMVYRGTKKLRTFSEQYSKWISFYLILLSL